MTFLPITNPILKHQAKEKPPKNRRKEIWIIKRVCHFKTGSTLAQAIVTF